MKKYILSFIFLFAIISCQTEKQKTSEEPSEQEESTPAEVSLSRRQMTVLNLKIDTLPKRNLSSTIKINGEMVVPPSEQAAVSAVIGGNIKKINVFQGDKVRKGQVLAVLTHPNYIKLQEDYAQEAQGLDYLKADYERQKKLYNQQAGSGKVFQKAQADYLMAKSRVKALATQLKLLHLSPEKVKKGQISSEIFLIAPINGYITQIKGKIGAFVNPKEPIFEIVNNNAIHPDFKIYEKDADLVNKGQLIHFTLANRPEKEYTAKVFAIGKEFEPETRSIPVHAHLTHPVKGLIPGMYLTGHLHKDNAYVTAVPHDAIVKKGTKFFIFATNPVKSFNKQTNFKMIEVLPGEKDQKYVAIQLIDSLPKGAKIVLNNAYYLLSDIEKSETGDDD